MDLTDVLRTVRGMPTGLVEMEKCLMSMISTGEESVEVGGSLGEGTLDGEEGWGI